MRALPGAALVVAICYALCSSSCAKAGGAGDSDGAGTVQGQAGSAGTGGAGGGAGTGGASGYLDMSPPLGEPLPAGASGRWIWNEVPGSQCRDGSPAGFWYKRSATSKDLLFYLEGGGACFTAGACALFSAANVKQRVSGEVFADASNPLGLRKETFSEPVQPFTAGIFDESRAENPVRDWNMVFVPFCTGDAHAGSRNDVVLPDDTTHTKQQFVGYLNMQKFVARIVPTFADARRVLLAGSSAGGFGAGLNFNQVQDAFAKVGSAHVTVLMDSAVIYDDAYLDPCLQKQWRELWGLDRAIPPDCTECWHQDGGGLLQLVFFGGQKYPDAQLGVISGTHDSLMRFFLASGENHCQPPQPLLVPADKYKAALGDLRVLVKSSPVGDGYGTYFIESGTEPLRNTSYSELHQWLQFERFYTKLASSTTPAEWVGRLLQGEVTSLGP